MNEVGFEIVKSEETEKNGIKYLNINVSNSEVERNPDIVRICADAGILEYVKSNGDLISQQVVLDVISELNAISFYEAQEDSKDCYYEIKNAIKQLLSNQEPKIERCSNCRHWKDSDGVFRRGIGAESQCPMNRKEVYEGNGYCYMFAPKESENKE